MRGSRELTKQKDEENGEDKEKSSKLGVSPTQVAGGAMASATAAYLGGQLGVAGTIIGASLTSVVITVGGSLYQKSLETAKERAVQVVGRSRKRSDSGEQRADEAGEQARPDPEATRRIEAGMHWPDGQRVLEAPQQSDQDGPTRIISAPESTTADRTAVLDPDRAAEESPSPDGSLRRRRRWVVAAVTSGLAFVLGMVLITGYEGMTGRPVSGGSQGTTIGQLLNDPGGAPPPPEEELPAGPVPTEQDTPETTAPETTEPRQPGSSDQPQPSGEPGQEPDRGTTSPPPSSQQQPLPEQPSETSSVDPSGEPQSTGEISPGQRIPNTDPTG